MTFNQKHERYVNNLDGAYDALLESREQELLELESRENDILQDEELFTRIALLYGRATLNAPGLVGFLDFASNQLKREREQEHTKGWQK